VENLSPGDNNSLHPDKKVVFVRRIPSVFELSRRVIEAYDHQFTCLLIEAKAIDLPKDFKYWKESRLREFFATEAKNTFEDADEIEEPDNENEELAEEDPYNVSSKYYSLFTIRKAGKYRTTDCSNFRNRFLKEFQLFSVFMQPGADYLGEKYTFNTYQYQGEKRNYAVTARKIRFHSPGQEKTRLSV